VHSTARSQSRRKPVPRLAPPVAAGLSGCILVALALAVTTGWIGRYDLPLQDASRAAMVLSSALGFGAIGVALASTFVFAEDGKRLLQMTAGSTVVLIGLVALSGHLTGGSSMIDWPALHRWQDSGEPYPGRMSLPTAALLVLAGATLVLMNRVRTVRQGLVVQGFTALIVTMGLIGVIGWTLRLHLVYEHYLLGGMSLLSALGFALAGTGLWLDWRQRDWYRGRALIVDEGLHITLSAIALLAIMLAVTLTAGLGILTHQLDASSRKYLVESLDHRADQLDSAIERRVAQAEIIAAVPAHLALMRNLNAQPGDEKSAAQLRQAAENLLPSGFSAIAFQSPSQLTWAEAGRFAAQPDFELALEGDQATLLWDQGLVLRVTHPVTHVDAVVGRVLTEQRLGDMSTGLQKLFDPTDQESVEFCGRRSGDLVCFPRRADAGSAIAPPLPAGAPMERALRGETGVRLVRDAQGSSRLAAHGPVGKRGLGLVVQLRTAELYALLRQELYLVIVLLAVMVAVGSGLIYWRVAPLARRLVLHEHRLKLALDSSRSAVWDLDLANSRVYLSEQWPALLGEAPRATSVSLQELYDLVHRDDLAQVERKLRAALRSDDVPYDVEHRVRTPDGAWTWIHSVGKVVERDPRGRALRMIGVNTNIARRKQAESFIERRASRDEATGLPNRAVFTDRLQTAMARARRAPPDRSLMAMLFISIEEIREIEDTMGKDAAHTLLSEITERLQGCVRATDTIARMGSDEFTVLLEELGLTEQACGIADKIIATLRHRIAVGRIHVAPTTSIGIAFYDGVIKVSGEDLVAKAQNAMHEARNDEPNTYRVGA
jgi:diguanylate cyclase (GGDEF)-like protein/PAS domain S-box-containing protein